MINYVVVGQDRRVSLAVLQAVRSFTDAGCMVIGSQHNRGLRWSSLCEQQATIRFDGADDDDFVNLVNGLTRLTRHVVVIPADCHAIRLVNRVAARLSVTVTPVPDTPTMTMLDDHWRFQRLCRQLGLAVPASRLIGGESEPDFPALGGELGLPFLVKPVSHDNAPSDSVLVRCRRDLWRLPARGLLVAQAIADGVQVDISLLSDRGQLTAFAICGVAPQEAERLRPELERVASRLCHATAFHGAMRLRACADLHTGTVTLVDCTPHFWAGMNSTILAGLNLVAECVRPSVRREQGVHAVALQNPELAHPLAPQLWSRLRARDEAGRLLRAMSMDLYSLSLSTGTVLRRAMRGAAQRPAPSIPRIAPPLAQRQDATAS